jgi:GNAT superfamily N-acetyltransferase
MRIVEWQGGDTGILNDLCLHPDDPAAMRRVMCPYVDQRMAWLRRMAPSGLWVAVATLSDGQKAGLIECVPIELAAEPVEGGGGMFINCLWVLRQFSGQGAGAALLEYVLDKAGPDSSVSVLAYEGDRWFGYFSYMPARFFRRFGLAEVDRDGSRVLLHRGPGSEPGPKLMTPRSRTPEPSPTGLPVVEVLTSSQCPWAGWMYHRVVEGLRRLPVEVRVVSTDDPDVVREYGLTRGVCVNGYPLVRRMASGREVVRKVKDYLRDQEAGSKENGLPDVRQTSDQCRRKGIRGITSCSPR